MARKTMTKEVTSTTVKIAKTEMGNDGLPVSTPLPDVTLVGNITQEKAQRVVNKMYDHPVTVFHVIADTKKYQMPVEKFIEVADEVTEDETEQPKQEKESTE